MDQTVQGKTPQECCGCGACAAVCPKKAITMKEDQYGCVYPSIDVGLCVNCGACLRVCAYGNMEQRRRPLQAWAAVGKEASLVEKSASGGVLATVAKSLMEDGGTVCGAVLSREDGALRAEHILSGEMEDLPRLQGSKYVHSQAWRCYAELRNALASGKTVLFSGTPCQVAAVKRLTGDPDNLITMDLVCHGVPPLRMLNEFGEILGKRLGGHVENIVFRDKTCGKNFCARVDVTRNRRKRSYYLSAHQLSFYRHFLDGSIYRENCYFCPYANLARISDLTIGDYWGIEERYRKEITEGMMPNRKDWSCILVNTEKGASFLRTYGKMLSLFTSCPEWIAEGNEQLKTPSRKSVNRDHVLKEYVTGGYKRLERAYVAESGGRLRFCWRMFKNIRRNKKLHDVNKGIAYED